MQAELLHSICQSSDLNCVAFSQNCLAACSGDKAVRVYSMHDFAELPISPMLNHKYQVVHCAFSSNGERLATCSVDGTTALVDVWSGNRLAQLENPSGKDVRVCRFSPTGSILATGSIDGVLCIWELAGYTCVRRTEAHDESLTTCDFSADGSWLVTGSSRGDLALWDAQYTGTRPLTRTLDAHDLGVTDCRFSPVYDSSDAKKGLRGVYLLATAGADDCVRLWELCAQSSASTEVALTRKMTLKGHTRPVYCCCFSPDGTILASGGCDYVTILWDSSTGQQLHAIAGEHKRFVNSCAFSRDGRLLATASSDKSLKIWRIAKTQWATGKDSDRRTAPHEGVDLTASGAIGPPEAIPSQYLCPITCELMLDPVVASDGFTYERSAIENWMNLGRRTSPMTNAALGNMILRSDLNLALSIQAYKQHLAE